MLLNPGNITLTFFAVIPSSSMHFPLRRSVYKETMMLALPTEISQCSWHYISHCKFASLCKLIPREFDYCVCPSPAPSGDASPLCLLNTSSFLGESRVSDPGPWKIHQSKCHLVSLMTSLIAQHVLLSQTSTVTCDYYEYFTHSLFTLNVRSWLKLADTESILAQEQSFPVRLAPGVSLNWLHPNRETKFSPFHSHHEAATYSKIAFKQYTV